MTIIFFPQNKYISAVEMQGCNATLSRHSLMAAVISTTAFASTSLLSIGAKFNHSQLRTAKCLSRRRRQRLSVSNTVENIPESSSSSEVVDKDSSSSVLPPRSFTSLITSSNIKKALEGVECVSVDHYARLEIPRGCSYAEVREAFKRKCEDLMHQELDEEKAQSKIQDLKESYEILSSEEERRFYDWSVARVENKERYVWPYEVDITQRSSAECPPQEEDDPRPTAYVRYFFLGWLVLAFILSFTLK